MSMTWGELSKNLFEQAKLKKVPLVGQFELTSRCNLKCKMCYVCNSANDREVMPRECTAKEWISLIREARDSGMLYILLTGGEVFLRKDFKEIYEAVSMMGLNVMIYTNGTLITPEIAKWLGHIPPSKIEVTLYGASPETYEKVCGNSLGFSQALNGIDLLLSEGISLKLRTTVIKENSHDFDKIAEIADERGLELGIVDYISPRRDGCRTYPEGERLSPQELAEYLEHVDDYFLKKKNSKSGITQSDDILFDNNNKGSLKKNVAQVHKEEPFYCDAGKCAFWVTWDGRMTPCGLMSEPVVYPFLSGFNNTWKELMKLCSAIPVCDECIHCSLKNDCNYCPGRLKNESGFYNKPGKYLCDLVQSRKRIKEASETYSTKALKIKEV